MTKQSKKQSMIRKSKQLKEMLKKDIDVSNQPIIKEPLQKSSRIFEAQKEKLKPPPRSSILCQEIKEVGKQRLQSGRQRIDIIPIPLRCADLSKESLMRLGIKSCFCCDNFRTDCALKPQLVRQDDASYQKYGCQRHVPIQVNVKYSH